MATFLTKRLIDYGGLSAWIADTVTADDSYVLKLLTNTTAEIFRQIDGALKGTNIQTRLTSQWIDGQWVYTTQVL